MNVVEEFRERIPSIEGHLGYAFKDKELLLLAFVHRSFVNENRDLVTGHNERLEFLGDSVLGLLVAEHLYREHPDTPEGQLSASRSLLVQASSCAGYIDQLELDQYVLMGRGEHLSGGRGRDSIQADLFEAILGAIYLDGGLKPCHDFLIGHFATRFAQILEKPDANWKARLQDYTQHHHQLTPTYEVITESGPDHAKQFVVGVYTEEVELGRGEGASKKEAQQMAARDALDKLGELDG